MELHHKLLSLKELKHRLSGWKLKSQKIVFTNGCFDILHPGHTTYLSQAKALGHRLVLGLNTDASVKAQNKAPNRPLNSELARAAVLSALASVDAIVLFGESTPKDLIDAIIPDILVKGGDYDASITDPNHPDFIVGSDTVRKHGGTVVTIPFVDGFSTTQLVKKIEGNGYDKKSVFLQKLWSREP